MEKLYLMAKGHTLRFPNGNEPFQITTRILEECGEVAQEVNRFEKSGVKQQKHGCATKQDLASEIRRQSTALYNWLSIIIAKKSWKNPSTYLSKG